MMNRNMERELRRRERERLADLNRDDQAIFRGFIRITVIGLAILISVIIWLWAAAAQAEAEAYAAVLRRTRLIREDMTDVECLQVPPLPEFPPEDGEPPEAIEIKTAAKVETLPEETQESSGRVSGESWESLGTFRLTFYCPCYKCSEGWGHQTASGATAAEGVTVAVDPRVIPYGTRLKINGREYIAQDCGGDIKGHRIDVFMESHQECLRNGIQHAEVLIRR